MLIIALLTTAAYALDAEAMAVFVDGEQVEINYENQTVVIPAGATTLTIRQGTDKGQLYSTGADVFPAIIVQNEIGPKAIATDDAVALLSGMGLEIWTNASYNATTREFDLPIAEIRETGNLITLCNEGFAGWTLNIKEEVVQPLPYNITVSGTYKTEYAVGDTFDQTGIVVTATMSDGTTKDVTTETTFSGFDSTSAGEKTITAVYGELTATFAVTVKDSQTPVEASVTPSITPTTVKAGEDVVLALTLTADMENITNFDYYVYFNDELFTLKSSVKGDSCSAAQISEVITETTGEHAGEKYYSVNFVDPTSNGITVNAGVIYTLTFTARTDITEEQTALFTVIRDSVMDTSFAQTGIGNVVDGSLAVTVQPDGEEPPVPSSGYSAAIGADQTKAIGETATVNVTVNSTDADKWNAIDMTFTYDPAALQLTSKEITGFTVADESGTIRVQGYGDDRDVGTGFALTFKCLTAGETEVKLTKVYVDASAHAISADAPEATATADTVKITVNGYPVTMDDKFTGDAFATPNADYTFTVKDKNYDYTFTATMGGEEVQVVDNGDGTYTVRNVTGELVISATATPKSFTVTVNGSAKDDVKDAAATATYQTAYTFSITKDSNYTYETPVITIGGAAYTDFTSEGDTYTIPGADITGDIVITVAKTELPPETFAVSFDGTGAGDVTGESSATEGQDYTFTVNKAEGYDYAVSVTIGGSEYAIGEPDANGKYTIPGTAVTGKIVITVTKTAHLEVEIHEFVKLNGKTMYLVLAKGTLESGKTYTYDGGNMYYVANYEGYAWLTVETAELTKEAAAEKVATATATAEEITVNGDVNGSSVIDINDAQLVYDMYNARYEDFAMASMEKFLRGDLNKDLKLSSEDAVAVVALIP